jgi:hypothetical protein
MTLPIHTPALYRVAIPYCNIIPLFCRSIELNSGCLFYGYFPGVLDALGMGMGTRKETEEEGKGAGGELSGRDGANPAAQALAAEASEGAASASSQSLGGAVDTLIKGDRCWCVCV